MVVTVNVVVVVVDAVVDAVAQVNSVQFSCAAVVALGD